MDSKDWAYLVGQIIVGLIALIGALPVLRRAKSQNQKDNMDAVKVALEIAGIDAGEQLELRKTVKRLTEMLEKRRYKIAVVFKLGENPNIEEATIESYEIAAE